MNKNDLILVETTRGNGLALVVSTQRFL